MRGHGRAVATVTHLERGHGLAVDQVITQHREGQFDPVLREGGQACGQLLLGGGCGVVVIVAVGVTGAQQRAAQ